MQSPSSRRAWIEIERLRRGCPLWTVALLAEGVDRNPATHRVGAAGAESPSSRRAWIEIDFPAGIIERSNLSPSSRRAWIEIAFCESSIRIYAVALLAEGVDRNFAAAAGFEKLFWSPSSRRAWIEMAVMCLCCNVRQSPSSRRAWIEMISCMV